MTRRPTSITIIGWILIGTGLFALLGWVFASIWVGEVAANKRITPSLIPNRMLQTVGIGGMLVGVVCGYFLLQGRNWARLLYVIWTPIQLAVNLVASPLRLQVLPGVLIFLAICLFLFLPQANAFFAKRDKVIGALSKPSTRRVLSVLCYLLAGFRLSSTCLMALAGTPGQATKWFVLGIQLLPALVFLSIGRFLSPEHHWMQDIGIVFFSAAICGAFIALSVSLMHIDPNSQKSLQKSETPFFADYLTGILWIAGMGALGGLFLNVATKRSDRPSATNLQVTRTTAKNGRRSK